MSESSNEPHGSEQVQADRQLLLDAQQNGRVLGAYLRLSGPGWLQSAITLGGGSLASALFLGTLGGTSLLWLQVVAITMGVVMLSAISYVTLSTGRRPFEAINSEINPALGWGWLLATALANIIWCMPQFSLSYDAIDRNLAPMAGVELGSSEIAKLAVTIALFAAAVGVVLLKAREGRAAKLFDALLKAMVGLVVVCFFGVAVLLVWQGEVSLGRVAAGLVPDFSQWRSPAGELAPLVDSLPDAAACYWSDKIMASQRAVMIAAAATAVGINMTFLLPYSMLARKWDLPFRGLARFDLATGMAIPYVLVTSCVVIAAGASFHNKIDDALASTDPEVFATSPLYESVKTNLYGRVELGIDGDPPVDDAQRLQQSAALPVADKRLAAALSKRNAFQLSQTLTPLLGEQTANLVFGLGVLGMGFSSIIILMLINGYAFREMLGLPDATAPFVAGVLVAGASGASWVWLWAGGAKFWLAIFTSTFGMMLLPIAYVTFFLMMNSRRILGEHRPTGAARWVWNLLMGAAVLGAIAAAATAIVDKASDPSQPLALPLIATMLGVYAVLIVLGFAMRRPGTTPQA